jgi:Putative amidoligase enzyme
MKSPIKKWGIELEAGWSYKEAATPIVCIDCGSRRFSSQWGHEQHLWFYPDVIRTDSQNLERIFPDKNKLKLGWKVTHDGSIEIRSNNNALARELIVEPPAQKLDDLKHDLVLLWNSILEVNSSMGCHIHISFGRENRKIYALLSSWEFVDKFQKEVTKEFKEVGTRISRNEYCRKYPNSSMMKVAYPDQIHAMEKEDCRRRPINFSYKLHHSIEFRAFPMQKKVERVMEYLDFVDYSVVDFLSKLKSGEIKSISMFNNAMKNWGY